VYNVVSLMSRTTKFSTLSHDMSMFQKNLNMIYRYHVSNIYIYMFGTALQNNQEVLILKITELYIIINLHRLKCKVTAIFVTI